MLVIVFIVTASTPFWIQLMGHIIGNILAFYLIFMVSCLGMAILVSVLGIPNALDEPGKIDNTAMLVLIGGAFITIKLKSEKK